MKPPSLTWFTWKSAPWKPGYIFFGGNPIIFWASIAKLQEGTHPRGAVISKITLYKPCRWIHCCWWKKNPAHQLRLVVYPTIYKVLYIPGGCFGFLNHQQYYVTNPTSTSDESSRQSSSCRLVTQHNSLASEFIKHPERYPEIKQFKLPKNNKDPKMMVWPRNFLSTMGFTGVQCPF